MPLYIYKVPLVLGNRHRVKMIYDHLNHSQAPPRSRPTCHIPIIIRPDTAFWHRPQISAPSEIRTQRNKINRMRLTSPKGHLSKTIHHWLPPFVSCRIVRVFMHFQQTRPNDGYVGRFCKLYLHRLYILNAKRNVTKKFVILLQNYILYEGDIADCHPSKSIVDLGSASVDKVSSEWQSTKSPRQNVIFTY